MEKVKERKKKPQKRTTGAVVKTKADVLASEQLPEQQVKPPEPDKNIKVETDRKWWKLVLGAGMFVLGMILMMVWVQDRHATIAAFFGVLMAIAGGYILWEGYKGSEAHIVIGDRISVKDANALALYPDKIEFIALNDPRGLPHLLLNNSRYYYWYIWDKTLKKLVEFTLADNCKYYEPTEFANVLNQPAYTKWRQKRVTLFQQIAPGILLVANIFAMITLIAMAG